MNYPLLMCVLNCVAKLNKQVHSHPTENEKSVGLTF